MFDMFKKENAPLENFVLSILKENKYDAEKVSAVVYARYPFMKKNDLKKVIAEIIKKKMNGEKLGGIWRKVNKKWQMVALNYNDLAHGPKPSWYNAPVPSDVGRANRFILTPSGHDSDRYEVPKLDEIKKSEEYERVFKQLKNKFANALPGIENEELDRIVLEEIKRIGFEDNNLKET